MTRLMILLSVTTLLLLSGCGKTEKEKETAAMKEDVIFTSHELYPEGIAYDAESEVFYVTSLHHGTVGKVNWEGKYTEFIAGGELPSTIGIELDAKRNRLLVCISDPGVSIYTNPEMQKKTAKLAIFDLETGKRTHLIDLGVLKDGYHFANDIALDPEGNAYVTDSFSPFIYKVTPVGAASVFVSDERWKSDGFGLNGIVYHPGGFLIAAHSSNGTLYRISIANPAKIDSIASENSFLHADGLMLIAEDTLAVAQNEDKEISRVVTADGWDTANKDQAVVSKSSYPTTMTKANGAHYVLNAKLNEIFSPGTALTSDFTIQKLDFE